MVETVSTKILCIQSWPRLDAAILNPFRMKRFYWETFKEAMFDPDRHYTLMGNFLRCTRLMIMTRIFSEVSVMDKWSSCILDFIKTCFSKFPFIWADRNTCILLYLLYKMINMRFIFNYRVVVTYTPHRNAVEGDPILLAMSIISDPQGRH